MLDEVKKIPNGLELVLVYASGTKRTLYLDDREIKMMDRAIKNYMSSK